MSYDVTLFCPVCKSIIDGCDWNYTSNVCEMLIDVGLHPSTWDGKTCDEMLPVFEGGIKKLESDPEKYRAMNPENGWGSYDRMLEIFLYPILREMRQHKTALFDVNS